MCISFPVFSFPLCVNVSVSAGARHTSFDGKRSQGLHGCPQVRMTKFAHYRRLQFPEGTLRRPCMNVGEE